LPGQRVAPARTSGWPTYIALNPADGAMYVPGGAVSRLSAAVITFTVGGTAATGQYQPLEDSVAVATSERERQS
jgi:hypothetical protein